MKHCASSICPFAQKHGAPSEFRDDIEVCADCGGPLTNGPAPAPVAASSAAAAATHPSPWRALLVTLAVLAAPTVASEIPLPGVDEDRIARVLGAFFVHPVELSPFALGLGPILTAFTIVELAALAVPTWRPLRHGGLPGRAKLLRATLLLTLVLAFSQGFTHARYLDALDVLTASGLGPTLLVAVTLTAGTFAYVALAHAADRWALAGGYSLLAGAVAANGLYRSGRALVERILEGATDGVPLVLLGTMAVVAITGVVLVRRRAPGELRIPSCGIVPVHEAGALIALPLTLGSFGLRGFSWGSSWSSIQLGAVGVLALLYAYLFNRPAQLAPFAGEGIDVTRPLIRAGLRSAAFVLALAFLPHVLPQGVARAMPDPLSLVVAVAVILDIAAHWRARRALGDLVAVRPEHRVYAIDAALDALDRAGIAGHARGVHHRVLWQFFGPFLPIVLYAPKDRLAEAERILARVLDGERRAAGAPYRASA